nr:immunoglobulin heavy chain junction region [Macaca mulatta]MOV49455.1 immunoglobulin heavy chain junction region [Macaca mulatta]MOV49764.1 immunoglobulin heavy chain junction region [Macaca mulatta]MOV50175.1 immunoglobulin heavy chain junction region [Macaca mulatta]MOV50449.1 immunoglobulin heavy chain junction region [Macaca mulatta]
CARVPYDYGSVPAEYFDLW